MLLAWSYKNAILISMTIVTRLTPPVARPQRVETTLHGHTLVDDYAWLRNKDSAETLGYLQAENDYAAATLDSTTELQGALYREIDRKAHV